MKLLYNVTISIDQKVEEDWKKWMMEVHIPDVMSSGKFISYSLHKVLGTEKDLGVTYAVQYIAPNQQTYDQYQQEDAPKLQAAHHKRYNGYYGAFRTLMQIISHS